MKYKSIVSGRFLERPNRFIAYVEIEGNKEKVHVKNTGRCRELLTEGASVYLEKSDNTNRSTNFDLVVVEKGNRLVNMDSQAPNLAVKEWLEKGGLFEDIRRVCPETVYGNSRFDFYVETSKERIFIEVKGVTLENNNVVCFPDAPSDRAVKHVEELIRAKKEGYRTFVLFVVQMEGVKYFIPNRQMHPEFAEVLCKAKDAGVEVIARDCKVTKDSMEIQNAVSVLLQDNIDYLFEMWQPLLKWYDKNHRILPWRSNPTPYHVWVSEIMLQQTRVEAVKPYYERFMKKLPDIKSLAEAEEEQLLKLWEGLGYYNRARNLQKAAIRIQEQYAGKMPKDYEKILSLNGIGSYTAGAISSICFGIKRPAVDGNVLRVLSRLRKDQRLITDSKVKAAIETELLEIMPQDRPGDFNQAMMEIGACVCVPNGKPHCEECPLSHLCKAHIHGVETDFPIKEMKKSRMIEKKTVLVIRDENKTAIRKRSSKGLLAGMYEFPTLEGHQSEKKVAEYLAENGIRVIRIQKLREAKHIFTHKEWQMTGYMIRVDELENKNISREIADWIYIEPEETKDKYPIPSAYCAYTEYLNMRLGVAGEESANKG